MKVHKEKPAATVQRQKKQIKGLSWYRLLNKENICPLTKTASNILY